MLVHIISESQPLVDSKSFYMTDNKTMAAEFVCLCSDTKRSSDNYMVATLMYSRTSVARTLVARLPPLFQTRS